MAPLSKLTLTSYRRTQPNRDPVEERRSKTLAALEQQKLVLAAALNGQEHIVTKPGWARDGDGNRQRIEKTHAVRPWFFQDAEGVDGVLVSFLRLEFNNFTVDSMTDTMLRHAYLDIVNDLEQVVPWLRFLRYMSEKDCNPQRLDTIQKQLPIILENALNNPSISDAHVFTLCELSGSFEPAMRLFKKALW